MLIYTVTQVTQYIKSVFDVDPLLQDCWVEGEISNFFRSAAGHVYFTLKDAGAQLRCVMWRSQVAELERQPGNGQAVVVHGRASVYEAQGGYQLYVDQIQPLGTGVLFLSFQELRDKLEREGLFAEERKRSLPRFPSRLGVVTSPLGAAIRDILRVLQRRYPLAEVIVAPTLVQGDEAPPQIVAAIEALNRHTDVDVILLARGGGSLEELWAFNDERVARAVFASRIPIITGVGHETDYTIADFVADVRAPTPSAAAEIAVPDQEALCAQVQQYGALLRQAMQRRLAEPRAQMDHALALLRRVSPRAVLDRRRQELDDRQQRMITQQTHQMALWRGRLLSLQLRLQTLSPESTLKRGYAIVSRRDSGAVVVRTEQVSPGDGVDVRVSNGYVTATVD
jgi:exodeoxyribonuclease VII large subunit